MAIREEVSGAGSMSKRTDLNVSKQPTRYISGMSAMGQTTGQEVLQQQQGAPMAATPEIEAIGIGALDVTPINADSRYPDEDILTGASFSNNGDSALLNLPNQQPSILTVLGKIAANDPTGDTELFMMMFQNRGIS